MKNLKTFPIGAAAAAIYVTISVLTGAWDKAWVIFLFVPVFMWLFKTIEKNPEDK